MKNVYSFSTRRPLIVSSNPHVDFYNALKTWTANARMHCGPEWRVNVLRAELMAAEAELLVPHASKKGGWRSAAARKVFELLKK